MTTPLVSKPNERCCRREKLRTRSPAPTSSSTDSAICAVTMACLWSCVRRSPVAPRLALCKAPDNPIVFRKSGVTPNITSDDDDSDCRGDEHARVDPTCDGVG